MTTPAQDLSELKRILSEHWRDEGRHAQSYPVCPECLVQLQSYIDKQCLESRTDGAIQALENMAKLFDKQSVREAKLTAKALREYGLQLHKELLAQRDKKGSR